MSARRINLVIAGAVLAAGLLLAPTPSYATTDFNTALTAVYPGVTTSCNTCHTSIPDPLNAYGLLFEAVPTHGSNPQGALCQIGAPTGYSGVNNCPTTTTTTGATTTSTGATTTTTTSTTSTTLASLDLDITKFKVTPKKVKLAKVKPFKIKLSVKNNGAVSSQTRPATVVGVQNGIVVYRETMDVSAAASKKTINLNFPAYTPTAAGDITWTATIADDDPDVDETPATTTVEPDPNAPPVPPGPVVWPCATSGDDTPLIANKHGEDYLLSSGEYVDACKFFAVATITSATVSQSGTVTVTFSVKDKDGNPVLGVPSISANISKLVPASGGESFNKWVPYIYRTETVGAGSFPKPAGTKAEQGYRESNGTFTDYGNGSYMYVFATNIANVVTPVNKTPITYDPSLTHRVSIMMGGHSGPTADAVLDFVPNGALVTQTRDIVKTTACYACHGKNDFHGHGGDRLTVENCVTCHNPGGTDAQGGQTLDMKVMLHKIHVGGELASIAESVPAGMTVWELTEAEREDFYAIWGFGNSKHQWWKAEFPAIIENCTKCHQGTGGQVDNWKEVPSRAACGSCHDNVDFAIGTNHAGGAQANDNGCGGCHPPEGLSYGGSVTEAHDWTTKDPRNIPEYELELTVSTPGNGTHLVAGESPVVNLVIKLNGTPIDHTVLTKGAATGCPDPFGAGCQDVTGDNVFNRIQLFVHGPRARRGPVLAPAADADIVSATAGPFNLSSAANLALRVDNEVNITVTVSGAAKSATATPQQIVDWLNGNAGFAARAIAYLEGGNAAIRSRNIGNLFALQLLASDVNTAVFGGDTSVHVPGGFYPSNELLENPNATYAVGSISLPLDPVDDLQPGTYVASIELANAGRINGSNYRTPSVAKTTFQVKQAAEELAVAGNCGSCHQGPNGTGFILDFPRHYKIFDNTAVDQCGACHDYQPQNATGSGWSGARPISKRVHGVHRGSELNYPLVTVDYSNGDPIAGREWDIEFPQDIRNCETCHPAATTSGSWKTKPARLPCSGCHDSDAGTAHIKLQTWDPTPLDPWSGDEAESCQVCH